MGGGKSHPYRVAPSRSLMNLGLVSMHVTCASYSSGNVDFMWCHLKFQYIMVGEQPTWKLTFKELYYTYNNHNIYWQVLYATLS